MYVEADMAIPEARDLKKAKGQTRDLWTGGRNRASWHYSVSNTVAESAGVATFVGPIRSPNRPRGRPPNSQEGGRHVLSASPAWGGSSQKLHRSEEATKD